MRWYQGAWISHGARHVFRLGKWAGEPVFLKKKKKGEGKERGGKEEKKKKMMERVCSEGKGKGRMRCGRKDEEGEEEGKEEEKAKHKMEKAIHERHRHL